jgi:hypothetical protein
MLGFYPLASRPLGGEPIAFLSLPTVTSNNSIHSQSASSPEILSKAALTVAFTLHGQSASQPSIAPVISPTFAIVSDSVFHSHLSTAPLVLLPSSTPKVRSLAASFFGRRIIAVKPKNRSL